jgi:nitrogen regulation protein NR(I)
MTMRTRLLLIEDDLTLARSFERVLKSEGYEVDLSARGDEGLSLAARQPYDLVITDLKLPGLTGLELVAQLHQAKPRLPIILMTAHGTTQTAIEATKFGACEYLVKPFQVEQLIHLVAATVRQSRLMSVPVEIGEPHAAGPAIIGHSRAMQTLYKEIGRVAATPVTVLIRGETGTGKELVALAIYQNSDRANKPLIPVNCGAIPETLLESELFGHEKGAFTGAHSRRIGRFEQASGGTLFLDEIGDLPANTQAKLLRVLQEKQICRLGAQQPIPVDTRILAATHQDLELAMQDKEFREDLYYRLSVVTLHLPPLRERAEDVPVLVRFFIQRYAGELRVENPSIQPEAIEFLQAQPWPGNVRQLENVVRQGLLLARPFSVSLAHIQQALTKGARALTSEKQTVPEFIAGLLAKAQAGEIHDAYYRMVAELEPELFSQALKLAQGNQARAARWLGIGRLRLREKLIEFGLHPGSQKGSGSDEVEPEL